MRAETPNHTQIMACDAKQIPPCQGEV